AERGVTLAALRGVLHTDDLRMGMLVRLAIAGQRRATLCGLQWADIDTDRRLIVFRRRVVVADGVSHVLPGSKTGKVVTVPIDAGTVGLLDDYWRHRQREAFKAG